MNAENANTLSNIKEMPVSTFKYRSFGDFFHKKLLSNRELYFPSTDQVNDPFDCKIPIQLKEFSGGQFIADAIELARKAVPGKSFDEYYQMATIAAEKNLVDNQEHMKMQRESEYEHIRRTYGVLCTSASWKNILLWSHYADCHRGFCVELNMDGLANITRLFANYWVNYVKDFPVWDIAVREPGRNTLDLLFTKFEDWRYEKEFRHVSVQHVGAVATLSPECFASLTLGVEVGEPEMKWAIENFKKINPDLPVYKARLSVNRYFALERDPIA